MPVYNCEKYLGESIESILNQTFQDFELLLIYDDSSDLNRAITLSDAYYGDLSSVVHLYLKTGKPIMIQKSIELGVEII